MEKIILYYQYVSINNPTEIAAWQQSLCKKLNLLGRILIAHEGINGTVSGTQDAIEEYKHITKQHPLFTQLIFKQEDAPAHCFPRLQVTVKKHIVHFGAPTNNELTGTFISAHDAHQLMQQQPDDLLIFDARNACESRVGKLMNAITADIEHFRELPTYFDKYQELFANKRVLMYCTGGIRCHVATAYLQQKNSAKEIMQLEGGIINYVQQYPNGFFRGKNYVFDGRVTVKVTDDILATCDLCTTVCDDYTHCLNALCNKQFICCHACLERFENSCSFACYVLIQSKQTTRRLPFKKAVFADKQI